MTPFVARDEVTPTVADGATHTGFIAWSGACRTSGDVIGRSDGGWEGFPWWRAFSGCASDEDGRKAEKKSLATGGEDDGRLHTCSISREVWCMWRVKDKRQWYLIILCRRDSCFDPTSKIMGTIEYVSEQSELECHDMDMRFIWDEGRQPSSKFRVWKRKQITCLVHVRCKRTWKFIRVSRQYCQLLITDHRDVMSVISMS